MLKFLFVVLLPLSIAHAQVIPPIKMHSKAVEFEIKLKQKYLDSIFKIWRNSPISGSMAISLFTYEYLAFIDDESRKDEEYNGNRITGVYLPGEKSNYSFRLRYPDQVLYNLLYPQKIRDPEEWDNEYDFRRKFREALLKLNPLKYIEKIAQLMKLKYELEEELRLLLSARMLDLEERRVHVLLTSDRKKNGLVEKSYMHDREHGIVDVLVIYIYVDWRRIGDENFDKERALLRDRVVHNPLGGPNVYWPEKPRFGRTYPKTPMHFHNHYLYRYWESLLREYDIDGVKVDFPPIEHKTSILDWNGFEYGEIQRKVVKAALESAAAHLALRRLEIRRDHWGSIYQGATVRFLDFHMSDRTFEIESSIDPLTHEMREDPSRRRVENRVNVTVKFVFRNSEEKPSTIPSGSRR